MMRRLLRALAAICVAVAGLIVATPTPSGAQAPEATGWWSRQLPFSGQPEGAEGTTSTGDVVGQSAGDAVRFAGPAQLPPVTTTPPPVPPPTVPEPPITLPDSGEGSPNPVVPEGGLWVGNDPTGAHAISALRFRGNIGAAELTLTIADGSTPAGPIVACPALSDWEPGPEGAWSNRPAHDCDRLQLTGALSGDATQIVFNLPSGFSEFGERQLDIILLPRPTAGDPYDLYFEAPDESSLEVLTTQAPPPPEPEPFEPDESTLPTTAPPTTQTSPSFDDGGAPTPTTAPSTDTAAPSADFSGDNGAPVPQPVAEVLEPVTESRAARILAVLLLLGIGLGLWWLSGQQVRQPRLLGGLAGNATAAIPLDTPADAGRGIGRFRRVRTGPPTKF